MEFGLGRPAVEVLIATYEERVLGLASRLPPPSLGVAWFVSHQVPSGRVFDVASLSARTDVRYFCWPDNGTSKNRNHALEMAHGEICLVADDDLSFVPGWLHLIVSAFHEEPRITFATFSSLSRDGRPRKSSDPAEPRPHNMQTIGAVSEVEIAFRLDAVRQLRVSFDERVGPGTRISIGEGYFFLRDILDRGGAGLQIPRPIVRHMSEASSGERGWATLSQEFVKAQGAVSFSQSGYRAFLSIPKHAVHLAMRDREWKRVPEFAWNLTLGAVIAERLRLSRATEGADG
jgi:glycosyltransferase involved in cell wall biosynthesis